MSGACVASHNAEKENSATVSGRQPTSRPDRVRPVSLSACAIRYTYTQPFPTKPQALCCALPQVSKNRPAYNVNGSRCACEGGKKKEKKAKFCLLFVCVCVPGLMCCVCCLRQIAIYISCQRRSNGHQSWPLGIITRQSTLSCRPLTTFVRFFLSPTGKNQKYKKLTVCVCAWLGRDIAQVDIYQTTQLLYFYIFI